MDETQPDPRPLQRNVIVVLLLALAAAAWAVLVWEHTNAAMDMAMASPDGGNDVSSRRAHDRRFP
jgi:predicted metal-binding membrane protein